MMGSPSRWCIWKWFPPFRRFSGLQIRHRNKLGVMYGELISKDKITLHWILSAMKVSTKWSQVRLAEVWISGYLHGMAVHAIRLKFHLTSVVCLPRYQIRGWTNLTNRSTQLYSDYSCECLHEDPMRPHSYHSHEYSHEKPMQSYSYHPCKYSPDNSSHWINLQIRRFFLYLGPWHTDLQRKYAESEYFNNCAFEFAVGAICVLLADQWHDKWYYTARKLHPRFAVEPANTDMKPLVIVIYKYSYKSVSLHLNLPVQSSRS